MLDIIYFKIFNFDNYIYIYYERFYHDYFIDIIDNETFKLMKTIKDV